MVMSQSVPDGRAGKRTVSVRTFTFLLIPDFSMMAFTAAVEPLRSANRMSGVEHYRWRIVSRDGLPVRASNGLEIVAHHAMADVAACDTLFVCSGIDAHLFDDRPVMAWLRKLARQGCVMEACARARISWRAPASSAAIAAPSTGRISTASPRSTRTSTFPTTCSRSIA